MSKEIFDYDGIIGLAGIGHGPGSDTEARANHAASLYLEGYAPLILLTGAYPALLRDRPALGYAEQMARTVLEHDIAPDAIITEPDALTTIENGLLLKPRLAGLPGRNFLLVTSDSHMSRSMATLQHVLGPDYHLTASPAGQSQERRQGLQEKVGASLTRLIFWQTEPGDDSQIASNHAEVFPGEGRERIFTPQQVIWNASKSYGRRLIATARHRNTAASQTPS